MATTETGHSDSAAHGEIALESSSYEIIRNRLNKQSNELRNRLNQLNEARKSVFGAIETTLIGTERVTTSNNCVPRDIVSIGDSLLFAYNVHFGLKSERKVADVFSVYSFTDGSFHQQPLDLLSDEQFERDFLEIYRYYKDATFSRFVIRAPFIYMVFQTGKTADDFKTFKWQVTGDSLKYLDNRSDHEAGLPAQHEFEWQRTTRDQHQFGVHPHVSIDDRVFVETVGGDLTIKIENNTDSGEGIYSEPVEHVDQTLDDADIQYAALENLILLKIRPYQESKFRYIVFNEKTRTACRVDAIGQACVLLPDDQGVIFPNGYYLQTGAVRTFEHSYTDMSFARKISAPNGEDQLFVFLNRHTGEYILLQYNLIEQNVDTPLITHGFTLFPGGELVCFKAQDEPQRHHALQIWQTPYLAEDTPATTQDDSYLFKIGNRDIVRGMAECRDILTLLDKDDSYANLYVDLAREAGDMIDSYFWIHHEQTFNLGEVLDQVRQTAGAAVDEFDKVRRLRQNTDTQTASVAKRTHELIASVYRLPFQELFDFVKSLADLRTMRGEIISLRELRYVDTDAVDSLESKVTEELERLSGRCVDFLLRPDALEGYVKKIAEADQRIPDLQKVTEAKQVEQSITDCATELEMLIEIISNLRIDDATQRTTIVDNISALFGTLNKSRATLKQKRQQLLKTEGQAEFHSQLKLLNQSVVNYLDVSQTPERCDDYLTKLMVQLEELEGRFAEFDEFLEQISEKREEVYNAFEGRKQSLVEARAKRADSLKNAADRILKGIRSRVSQFDSINDINGYFASDLMVDKVRDIISQLEQLEDSVKVDDIQSQLKSIREDTVRQLKDRQELFVDGQQVIKLGEHRFSVNIQPLELTTVIREDQLTLHLAGTDFFEPFHAPELEHTRSAWHQDVVSENADVYRSEYLAYLMLTEALSRHDHEQRLKHFSSTDPDELQAEVSRYMSPRYEEAYTKGVHDHDATRILKAVAQVHSTIGLLKYRPQVRAAARLYWDHFCPSSTQQLLAAQAQSYGGVTRAFPETAEASDYEEHIRELVAAFLNDTALFDLDLANYMAAYLFEQLQQGLEFVVSQRAARTFDEFQLHRNSAGFASEFDKVRDQLAGSPSALFRTLRDWSAAFMRHRESDDDLRYVDELATLLLAGSVDHGRIVAVEPHQQLTGLLGSHARIQNGNYELDYHDFRVRLGQFHTQTVTQFRRFQQLKKTALERARDEMKIDEFRPRVLTSFVRNRLLDRVYLPLIGANLAKQLGTAGDQTRTDRMGLLLLVSPPGYGKTTLMEYIANRLGLIFMKINGPAIGHEVKSLDPAAAPNAGAREEIEKLNLALEMGDNVLLYVDDIQHSHPEFLQKFISLCDAQRKIEGVYKGRTRTYDFRGRKVAVVMAGNPYTESGEKFQIPDMLANRADVYNLGEVVGENADDFELSYLENCLTSNPVLNNLATRSQSDVYQIVRMAQGGEQGTAELEGNYTAEELQEMVDVFRKLMRVRDVVLSVNREYIRSAAQADEYRTEPPFKLQGSYRNMNRIAEKVVAVMNEHELEELIVSNYENDAQTLTSGTESNLLKFKELTGKLTAEEQARWDDIKQTFQRNNRLRGIGDDDKTAQVLLELAQFNDNLKQVGDAVSQGFSSVSEIQLATEPTALTANSPFDPELAGALKSAGQSLSDSLREIRDQLAQLGDQFDRGTDGSDDPQTSAPGTLSSSADTAPETQAQAETTTGTDPRLTIVNRLPKSFVMVIERQFALMNDWLKPLLMASEQQNSELSELRKSLDACLKQYRRLLKRFDENSDE